MLIIIFPYKFDYINFHGTNFGVTSITYPKLFNSSRLIMLKTFVVVVVVVVVVSGKLYFVVGSYFPSK